MHLQVLGANRYSPRLRTSNRRLFERTHHRLGSTHSLESSTTVWTRHNSERWRPSLLCGLSEHPAQRSLLKLEYWCKSSSVLHAGCSESPQRREMESVMCPHEEASVECSSSYRLSPRGLADSSRLSREVEHNARNNAARED
jgi:hypothetical protein